MMDYREKIDNKIKTLGEMKSRSGAESPVVKHQLFLRSPDSFQYFTKKYGAIWFEADIVIKPTEAVPIAGKSGIVSVDNFWYYPDYLDRDPGDLPRDFLPICEGIAGDLICLCLQPNNFGFVYYWWHEAMQGEGSFLLATTFEDFILKLEIAPEDGITDEDLARVKGNYSDEFLEMLRKDGYTLKK